MPSEVYYGFSRNIGDGVSENAIWQCPEIMTVQAECMVFDLRKPGINEEFTVFYIIENEDDWKRELTRILHALGFELCMVNNHFVRKMTLSAFELHQKGKPLED